MRVLFVCTGNRFRSLLAEAIAKKKYDNHEFDSAGTQVGEPIHEEVKKLIDKKNLSEQAVMTPKQLDQSLISKADRIICMKENHKEFISENFEVETNIEIWGIKDADPEDNLERIYNEIRNKIGGMF